jgi:hypothetical protein
MITTRTRLTRRVSALVAGVMTAAGLVAFTAVPSQGADPVATFQWKVSNQFGSSLPNHTVGGGATEDGSKVVSFPRTSGNYNPVDGTGTINYGGWVQGGFANPACDGDGTPGDTTCYRVKIANPSVTVDQTGHGFITADVYSIAYFVSGDVPAGSTDTKRVKVTTFDADQDDWTPGSPFGTLTATPDWTGVLAPGSAEAIEAGITDPNRPYDGASFAQPFIKQLYPSVKAHFHQTSATAQPNKAPASFVAEAPTMAVTYTATSTNATNGLTLQVKGAGFRGVTNPGDTGVYVGVAESGGMPDVSSLDAMSNFAGSNYVTSTAINNGAFTTSVTIPANKLDPSKSYSIYTWQAHIHSNLTQDTQTPLTIDWVALQKPLVVNTTTSARVTNKKGRLAVTVTPASGATPANGVVKVVMKKGKKKKLKTRTVRGNLVNGKVALKAPKLSKGKWRTTVNYLGSATHNPSSTSLVVNVKKR